jgi:hypothetical protein
MLLDTELSKRYSCEGPAKIPEPSLSHIIATSFWVLLCYHLIVDLVIDSARNDFFRFQLVFLGRETAINEFNEIFDHLAQFL